jgi:hypothetical protein
LRRSSNGKSNSVASIEEVSSIDTRSTQLNTSPRGSPSRISLIRARTTCCSRARLAGATTGCTTLRCSSCFGGSMAMNIGSRRSSGRSISVIAPSDESTPWASSACMMSLYLVSDQYGPTALSRW